MHPRPLAPDQKTRRSSTTSSRRSCGRGPAPPTRPTWRCSSAGSAAAACIRCRRAPRDRPLPQLDVGAVGADGKPSRHGRPRFAPATVAKRLSAVRSFYGYLVDRGAIDASPAVGVKVPRTPREPRGHAITEDQVAKLIAAAEDHSDTAEAIVRLLVTNGLRVSEVCAALVEQLEREPDGGLSLQVEGKGGKLASCRAQRAHRPRRPRCRRRPRPRRAVRAPGPSAHPPRPRRAPHPLHPAGRQPAAGRARPRRRAARHR